MAKNWYPIIDSEKCLECGACVKKCPHDVYYKEKSPTPVVVSPEKCINKCHGCGNLCPVGAITYYRDNTGWAPPNGGNKANCGCGSDCGCGGNCC